MGSRPFFSALAGAIMMGAAPFAYAQSETSQGDAGMGAPIVFFDIAGPDMASQSAFYRTVFGWDVAPDGRFSTSFLSPPDSPQAVNAQIRPDPAEKVLYIGVPDVTATLALVEANGGAVVAPRFGVPGVVILGLFTDPAGNRMGLVEIADGKAVVP